MQNHFCQLYTYRHVTANDCAQGSWAVPCHKLGHQRETKYAVLPCWGPAVPAPGHQSDLRPKLPLQPSWSSLLPRGTGVVCGGSRQSEQQWRPVRLPGGGAW